MKYLGIDYGSKRVGLALSDPTESFAIPHSVLENNKELLLNIENICKKEKVETIVVGESKDYSGRENEIMREILPFVDKLIDKLGIEVHMHPEFLSSQEAERVQGKNTMHDASAAAIILKSYLDVKNQK